jgi:hypothetical protein
MTNTQAMATVFVIIAAMLFANHDWLAGLVAMAMVAAPALWVRRKRA